MNSIESIKPDELIEEYGEWLKHESSAKDLGEWKEITLPMFDHSNDDLIFYAKTAAIASCSPTTGTHSNRSDRTASQSQRRGASAWNASPANTVQASRTTK